MLPDDFHIVFGRADKQLENLFEQFRTILSYLYIVSASSISLGKMQLQINGQNNELEFEHISNNLTAYEIYHWIFFDGNVIDKAAIARNILSLHNRDSEIININKTILSEIQSSFNLYLKEHVERYLMLKKDIVDYSYEITEKFGEYITELPNRFMKNLTTAAAFLFTIVLTNAVEQGSPERIFTSDVTIILEFVLLGSLIYLMLTCYELREKVKLAEYSVYNITKNYQDVLSESDINLIHNTLQNAKGKLDKAKCKWISGWFIGIVVLFIALTFISQDPLPIMQHFIQPRAMWVIDWFNMHMYSRST